jgi:Mn2+/Fe2+ NRAMP family transporter
MAIAVVVILIPNAPLIAITIWSQVINAIALPAVLISMIFIINNKKIMGAYVNNRLQNIVAWVSIGVIIAFTVMLMFPQLIKL